MFNIEHGGARLLNFSLIAFGVSNFPVHSSSCRCKTLKGRRRKTSDVFCRSFVYVFWASVAPELPFGQLCRPCVRLASCRALAGARSGPAVDVVCFVEVV